MAHARAMPQGVVGSAALPPSAVLRRHAARRTQQLRDEEQRARDRRCLTQGISGAGTQEELDRIISGRPPAPPAPPPAPQVRPAPPAARLGAPDLVYVRRAPRPDELVGNLRGRETLAALVRTAHTRAGRPLGQALLLVFGPPGCGKSHAIHLELSRCCHVACTSTLDFWGRKGDDTGPGGRRHLDDFLREQASSHTSDGKKLAVVLEEADELFAACPQALLVKCGALVVATMGASASSQEPEVYKMFKQLRDAAAASGRSIRFWRPSREESRRALLRLAPRAPPAVQRAILEEAAGDFRQLALVEELFRQRQTLQQGSLARETFRTPFEQAKDLLATGQLPQCEDADYATNLVVTNFAACCGDSLADLEAMAAVAAAACEADVLVTGSYRGNGTDCAPETAARAHAVVLRLAALRRPRPYTGDLQPLPDKHALRPERHAGPTSMGVVSVEAKAGAAEVPTGFLPLSLFRGAQQPKAPCIYFLHQAAARPLHERSWLGGGLYAGPGAVHHFFPVPGRPYLLPSYTLGPDGHQVDGTLRYDLDLAALGAALGLEVQPDLRLSAAGPADPRRSSQSSAAGRDR